MFIFASQELLTTDIFHTSKSTIDAKSPKPSRTKFGLMRCFQEILFDTTGRPPPVKTHWLF